MASKVILKEDIWSTFSKGYLYGKAGEIVELINETGNILIVEGKTGRFPVLKEKVIIKN